MVPKFYQWLSDGTFEKKKRKNKRKRKEERQTDRRRAIANVLSFYKLGDVVFKFDTQIDTSKFVQEKSSLTDASKSLP